MNCKYENCQTLVVPKEIKRIYGEGSHVDILGYCSAQCYTKDVVQPLREAEQALSKRLSKYTTLQDENKALTERLEATTKAFNLQLDTNALNGAGTRSRARQEVVQNDILLSK